jgi:hypothetical protein
MRLPLLGLLLLGVVALISVLGSVSAQDIRVVYISYLGLGVSSIWLLVGAYYVARKERRSQDVFSHDPQTAIRPFEHLIAKSKTPPWGKKQVLMEGWGDLVKVASILRRPVLQFVDEKSEELPHHMFFVTDGDTNYVYEFESLQGKTAEGPTSTVRIHAK